jgi:hypothetical protein
LAHDAGAFGAIGGLAWLGMWVGKSVCVGSHAYLIVVLAFVYLAIVLGGERTSSMGLIIRASVRFKKEMVKKYNELGYFSCQSKMVSALANKNNFRLGWRRVKIYGVDSFCVASEHFYVHFSCRSEWLLCDSSIFAF